MRTRLEISSPILGTLGSDEIRNYAKENTQFTRISFRD